MKHLPLNNEHFKALLRDFDRMVNVKGYGGEEGRQSYSSQVREFLFFIEARDLVDITEVAATDVIAYYEYLRERPNFRRTGCLSDTMVNHHLTSLRMFFDHLLEAKIVNASPAHLPKFNRGTVKERESLTEDEIKLVYKACADKRDRALISTAYGCGLRRNEIRKLNLNDVSFAKATLTIVGKGGKRRTIPLSEGVMRDLKEYLINDRPKRVTSHTNAHANAFFLNNLGTRPTGDYLNNLLKEIIARTQNPIILGKNITLHCLRHSIATHLQDNGAPPEFVQEFLGHSEIDTSMLYSKRRKIRLKIQQHL